MSNKKNKNTAKQEPEVKEQVQKEEAQAQEEKAKEAETKKYVNPVLAWGILAAEFVVAVIIGLLVV